MGHRRKSQVHAIYLLRLVQIVGVVGIFKGRSYFLPTAEAVLAVDRRSPILYLRSFLDEKPDIARYSGDLSHFDRSYEMKLSRYFSVFGPFVAIGSPKDKLPKLGALRLMRSEEEWQNEVLLTYGKRAKNSSLSGHLPLDKVGAFPDIE